MNPPRTQLGNQEAEFQHTGTKPFGPPPIVQISDTGLSIPKIARRQISENTDNTIFYPRISRFWPPGFYLQAGSPR